MFFLLLFNVANDLIGSYFFANMVLAFYKISTSVLSLGFPFEFLQSPLALSHRYLQQLNVL